MDQIFGQIQDAITGALMSDVMIAILAVLAAAIVLCGLRWVLSCLSIVSGGSVATRGGDDHD